MNKIKLGIDLGGGEIKATGVDPDGQVLITNAEGYLKTPSMCPDGPKTTVRQIVIAAQGVCGQLGIKLQDVESIGLDSFGPAINGVISDPPNAWHDGWNHFDLRSEVEQAIAEAAGKQIPVKYINDGDAAAWGEFSHSFSGSRQTVLVYALGSGVAHGTIYHGRLVVGDRGMGNHAPHETISQAPLRRVYGEFGLDVPESFWETRVSPTGNLLEDAAELFTSVNDIRVQLERLLPGVPEHVLHETPDRNNDRAYKVLGLATDGGGDEFCRTIFIRQATNLGYFLAMQSMNFDPSAIIIGGGINEAPDWFKAMYLEATKRSFDVFAKKPHKTTAEGGVSIRWAELGDLAASFGAALLAGEE